MNIKVRVQQNVKYNESVVFNFVNWEDVEVFVNLALKNGENVNITISTGNTEEGDK